MEAVKWFTAMYSIRLISDYDIDNLSKKLSVSQEFITTIVDVLNEHAGEDIFKIDEDGKLSLLTDVPTICVSLGIRTGEYKLREREVRDFAHECLRRIVAKNNPQRGNKPVKHTIIQHPNGYPQYETTEQIRRRIENGQTLKGQSF